MVGDSLKCGQEGPRAEGMLGFHLDGAGWGPVRDLVQFAQLVIASRRNHDMGSPGDWVTRRST